MNSLLGICLLGALLELDTTYVFQFTLSRGIIAGPLLGLMCGNVLAGLQVGIFTELLFLDMHPLGGLLPPSSVICCAVCMAIHLSGIPIYFAFFFGVLGAILFSLGEIYMRKYRSFWLARRERRLTRHPSYIGRTVWYVLVMGFIMTFSFLSVYSSAASFVLSSLLPSIPESMHLAGEFAYMAVPWIGFATLISTFRLKPR